MLESAVRRAEEQHLATIFGYSVPHPESEGGIAWNDPQIDIKWPLSESELILSDKDRNRKLLKEF